MGKAGNTGKGMQEKKKDRREGANGKGRKPSQKKMMGNERNKRDSDSAKLVSGEREYWKPGNMIYPLPAVMVSVGEYSDIDTSKMNILTVAWTGTVCTNPAMAYISVRPERHSYHIIKERGEFVINLTTKSLLRACDFCGVRSGRDVNKFKECQLTPGKGKMVSAPLILESPVNVECKVQKVLELGSHHMFLAEVVSVDVDPRYLDEKGRFLLNQSSLVTYSHGEYFDFGSLLGTFGYSVRKKGR